MAERPTETVHPEPQPPSVLEAQLQHAVNMALLAYQLEQRLAAATARIAELEQLLTPTQGPST